MVERGARIEIEQPNGDVMDLTWLAGVVVPPGMVISWLDLGWRNECTLRFHDEVVTIFGDLRSGERAVSGAGRSPLARYGLFLMQHRMQIVRAGRRVFDTDATAPSALQLIARVSGALWIPPDGPTPNSQGPATGPRSG